MFDKVTWHELDCPNFQINDYVFRRLCNVYGMKGDGQTELEIVIHISQLSTDMTWARVLHDKMKRPHW